jgi:transposase
MGSVARDLDLTETAVRTWVKQADTDDGRRNDDLTSADRAQISQLRRNYARRARSATSSKRAAAFFARETG